MLPSVVKVMDGEEVDRIINTNGEYIVQYYLSLIPEAGNFGCTDDYFGFNLHRLRKHVERVATTISILNTKKP